MGRPVPSYGVLDDRVLSSTALAGLADRWSSSIGERPLFLLGVVMCCREAADRLPGHPRLVQSPGERATVPLCGLRWREYVITAFMLPSTVVFEEVCTL